MTDLDHLKTLLDDIRHEPNLTRFDRVTVRLLDRYLETGELLLAGDPVANVLEIAGRVLK